MTGRNASSSSSPSAPYRDNRDDYGGDPGGTTATTQRVPAVTTTPAGVRGGVVGLLGMRDFRLLWAGETASMLGSSVAAVALRSEERR